MGHKDTISRTQLMALLWTGTLAPAAELLPALLLPGVGRNAWLTVLAAAPLVLLTGWLLGRLSEGRGLTAGIQARLGKTAGGAVLLIYMMWGVLLLALRLRACAERLLDTGHRDGSLWFFLLVLAAMVFWLGSGKLAALARAGQLFLAVLLTAALVVLGLSIFQARPERLLPVGVEGGALLKSAGQTAGVLGWALFGAFLAGEVQDQGERKGWHWLFWGGGGCLLLAAAQAVILGNLGAGLAARLENPFFALAKSVGVEGAFQRVESVIVAIWIFGDLALAGVLVFALRRMAEGLSARVRGPSVVAWAVFAAAILAGTLFSGGARVKAWNWGAVPVGNLVLGLLVPILLNLLPEQNSGKGTKRHI